MYMYQSLASAQFLVEQWWPKMVAEELHLCNIHIFIETYKHTGIKSECSFSMMEQFKGASWVAYIHSDQ